MILRPTLRDILSYGKIAINERSTQAAGLVTWWSPLASRGGNILRDLVGGQDGTLSAGVTWVGDPEVGWLMKFTPASAGVITVPDSPTLDTGLGNTVSFSFWMSCNNLAGAFGLFNKRIVFNSAHAYSIGFGYSTSSTLGVNVGTVAGTDRTLSYSISTSVFATSVLAHVVVVIQTDAATNNKVKFYVNGVLASLSAVSPDVAISAFYNSASNLLIGRVNETGSYYFDGYLGDIRIYNRLLTPEEAYQQWDPATRWDLYKVGNRFFFDYSIFGYVNVAATSHDHTCTSPEVKTNTAISSVCSHSHTADSLVIGRDIPSINNSTHNHETSAITITTPPVDIWNPLDKNSYITLSNQNLTATRTTSNATSGVRATHGVEFGKYYAELYVNNISSEFARFGITTLNVSILNGIGGSVYGWAYDGCTGYKISYLDEPYGNTWGTGDVISIAVDLDAHKVWFAKNGVWQASGNPETGANPAYDNVSGKVFLSGMLAIYYPVADQITVNFGHYLADFVYTIPSGFSAWEDAVHDLSINNSAHVLESTNINISILISNAFHSHAASALWLVEPENCTHSHVSSSPEVIDTLRYCLEYEYLMEEINGSTLVNTSGYTGLCPERDGTIIGDVTQVVSELDGSHELEFDISTYDDDGNYVSVPIWPYSYLDWTVSAYVQRSEDSGSGIFLCGIYEEPTWLPGDSYAASFQINIFPGSAYLARVGWQWFYFGGDPIPYSYWATDGSGGTVTDPVHIAIRRVSGVTWQNNGSLEFFANGIKIGETVVTNENIHGLPINHLENKSAINCIGAMNANWWMEEVINNTEGRIGKFRWYSRCLTDQEILSLARENFDLRPDSCSHSHAAESPSVVGSTLDIASCTHSHSASAANFVLELVVPNYLSEGQYDSPACQGNIGPPADYVSAGTYSTVTLEIQNYVLDVPDYVSGGQYWLGVFTLDVPDCASAGKYDVPTLEQRYLNVQFAGSLLCSADIISSDWHCVGTLVEDSNTITAGLSVPARFTAELTEETFLIAADFNVVGTLIQTSDTIVSIITVSYGFDFAGAQAFDQLTAAIQPTPMFVAACRSPADKTTATLDTTTLFGLSGADAPDAMSATLFAGSAFTASLASATDLIAAVLCIDPQFVTELFIEMDVLAALLVPQERFVGRTIRWPTTRPRFAGTLVEDGNILAADWDGGDT